MRIEAQNEFRIAVELTNEDLSELDITYDDLDYSNIETRRVLWTILDEARQTLGRDINLSEKMLIEAIPGTKGGCVIYFTVLPKDQKKKGNRLLVKKDFDPIICDFNSINGVIDVSRQLAKNKELPKSELYTYKRIYRLIIYPKDYDNKCFETTLQEFGQLHNQKTQIIIARTKEYWEKLAGPNALTLLGVKSKTCQ